MPCRQRSHSERLAVKNKRQRDRAYDRMQRKSKDLAEVHHVHGSIRWQKLRKMKLNRNPLCEDPYRHHADHPTLAREVDHIIPLRQDLSLAYDMENLQALCKHCHGVKSQQERRLYSA